MDEIHKKVVEVSVTQVDLNENIEDIETEYLYKEESIEFYNSFKINLTNLHDILFGYVRIMFYKTTRKERELIGAAKIMFKECYEQKELREEGSLVKRYTILDKIELEKASYFNANWNPIGVVTCKMIVMDRPELLDEKKQDTYIEKMFALFMSSHKTKSFKTLFNLLSEAKQGSFLCNFWAVVGCLLADYYYSFLYGNCDESNCNGVDCKKEFCEGGYYDMSGYEANIAYFQLQEVAAAYATGVPVYHLQKIRTREDITNKKYRAILERLTINDGDLIEYNEGHDSMSSFLIYFKRNSINEKPDTIAVSFRGTFSTNDAMNDLQSTYVEFQDGYTHAGFKKLADYFLATKMTQIMQIAEKKKIKKIFLTGHSLGAAVATLVHMRMEEKYPQFQVKSVVFASPPVLSENLVLKADIDLTHYAYGLDLVSRLSYGSILDLKYFCLSISSLIKLLNIPGVLIAKIDEIRAHIKEANMHPKLYHPGKQIHVMRFTSLNRFTTNFLKKFYFRGMLDGIIYCITRQTHLFLLQTEMMRMNKG